ncbi:uncharacterized protein BDR25DRAFT_314160 [Lindgomyces ingoldianus]|uniref:Uncharacterized protein n=1 Tax=Lindgomyces ingoldianus TaxID=673940 RepID=A0ACB6QVH5_9PLEO|nr:uncharacterized protein BDR25DRAFT_314160 [Lindgomyces ingoldianus]KAF2470988.1 hypothetical protein BDR25DRAFT_314160 [Lindgomyces ingoldianus]
MERPTTGRSLPRCCCGSQNCAFLAHNSSLLEGLERDVHKAAQLGQALLVRHEAYVADSERERRQMTATIESLEKEKFELEQRNAQTIKANRDLLDQLEQLNDAVVQSDAEVRALTDTLHSTEEEIQRLSSLAARTQSLEAQLIDLEREQAHLQGALDSKIGDERTAMQRWRRAEKTIGDLQDQMDRIEQEARHERERHEEIVSRMERRMAVGGELATAAGRLKAKAGQDQAGSPVVSHFVKDMLLDNANLQHGILELREMLMNSNEEVERLREQLRAHQPVPPAEGVSTPTPTLQRELAAEPLPNQELHIHHHYHGPPRKDGSKNEPHRRVRKKRYGITPGYFTPPVPQSPSPSTAILAQTTATVPPNSNRWSNATTLAPSSLPASPLSVSHRGSSIYDRVFSDVAYDSSRPTSPSESIDPSSPMFRPLDAQDDVPYKPKRGSHSLKPPSLSTIRSASTPISLTTKSSPATAIISAPSPQNSLTSDIFMLSPALASTIPEENENTSTPKPQSLTSPPFSTTVDDGELFSPTTQIRPSVRRAASHESLISISGMDIHTLQSRPSQLLLSSSPRFASPSSGTSSHPVLTPWTATATVSMSRRNLDSSTFNRSLLYGSVINQKRGINNPTKKHSSDTLGKTIGGWVFGKWGTTPSPSSSDAITSANLPAPSSGGDKKGKGGETASTPLSSPATIKRPDASTLAKDGIPVRLRPAGVNQSGPIWGFFDAIPPTPEQVMVKSLDEEALKNALTETES